VAQTIIVRRRGIKEKDNISGKLQGNDSVPVPHPCDALISGISSM
jgi:hypothetical protein